MALKVTAGFVTVITAVEGGRASVDIPRGAILPGDVPAEQREALLRRGDVEEVDPDGPGVDTDGDGVPEGSARQVLDWVQKGADDAEVHDRASMALELEQAKGDNARSTLMAHLSKLVEA
jgi:hypothetical protein